MRRTPLFIISALSALIAVGCAGADIAPTDHHGDEGEDLGSTSQALVATDPVSAAVTATCSTSAVKGLALQLVQEIECMRPKTMKRISGVTGISLGTSAGAVPYLQIPAADALIRAQKARGTTMKVNSGLRTLPQQFLLYQWYKLGRCGIGLAAVPGTSNHESGLAVDIDDNVGWRSAMEKNSYDWLGSKDPVHFNYVGSGSVALAGMSIKAFQRLWNRNHPTDRIDEDGDYGPQTEARLKKSPIGGFPKGALTSCGADAGVDAGPAPLPDAGDEDAPVESQEPVEPEDASPSETDASPAEDGATPPRADEDAVAESGSCSASSAPLGAFAWVTLGLALALAARRRRPSC